MDFGQIRFKDIYSEMKKQGYKVIKEGDVEKVYCIDCGAEMVSVGYIK